MVSQFENASGQRLLDRLSRLGTQVENHTHAVALRFTCYNFARIHETLPVSPAMQAGTGKTLWSVEGFPGW